MITIIKKICKGIIIAIGTLITLVALVGGSVGIAYKKEVVQGYTGLRTSILNIESEIKSGVSNADDLVNQIFTDGNNEITNLENFVNKLKSDPSYSTDSNVKTYVDEISAAVENIKSSVLNDDNEDKIKGYVNDFTNTINSVSSEIESYANDWTPQKFTKTYDDVTISLTAVSATILGVIILASIVQLALYKKVEGVRVRRTRVKSDLVKHMDKILKKYPNLKNDF